MLPAADIIGVNWGSANFRAYRIAADGTAIDEYAARKGVAGLDNAGMAAAIAELVARWPDHGPIYASGMIGSNIGWVEAPYALAPARIADLAQATIATEIGGTPVRIVPGITCHRPLDDAPDILRGEEIELFGLYALAGTDGLAALPGIHTKWVRLNGGRIIEFVTAMSGEIYDRLTAQGLLASVIEGDAADGPAFQAGVAVGKARQLGLGTLLFSARARVMRGGLARADSASYIRGVLIGSEIADALQLYPDLTGATVPLVGNGPLLGLYASALASVGVRSRQVDPHAACLLGFRALHEAVSG